MEISDSQKPDSLGGSTVNRQLKETGKEIVNKESQLKMGFQVNIPKERFTSPGSKRGEEGIRVSLSH